MVESEVGDRERTVSIDKVFINSEILLYCFHSFCLLLFDKEALVISDPDDEDFVVDRRRSNVEVIYS